MRKKLTAAQWAILRRRALAIDRALKKLFPRAAMILNYSNHWELLVAVILSAQCTDQQVNRVTPQLFRTYRTLEDYVKAKPIVFERAIYSTGFYKNKTKNILAAAKMLKTEYGGTIPKTMEEILRIPGVARKTANIVLGNAHGIVDGIAVDTHVKQFAKVYGLSDEENADKVERDLMRLFPKKDWFTLTYRIIEHGRKYRPGRKNALLSPLDSIA